MATASGHKIVGGGADGTFAFAVPEGPCVMRQTWRDLLFLHWEVSPELIQGTLPAGLSVDTLGGQAYVGIVPFQMARVRPRFLPPVPGLSWFGELNLRTYVVGPQGQPGVWFYSLDAHQRLAVWLAKKFFALPYHYARIGQRNRPDPGQGRRVQYAWRRVSSPRRRGTDPAFVYRTPPTREAQPTVTGTLSHWLVERYLLYSRRPLFVAAPGKMVPEGEGELFVGRVEHERYRVAEVSVEHADASLFGLNGFDVPQGPPVSALWSPGVDVSVYALRKTGEHDDL